MRAAVGFYPVVTMGKSHICQCLSRILKIRRDIPVTICENRGKTGKQFVENVLSLAGGLSELGLKPGDVVAIAALNSDFYLEWLLAVTFIGGIAAPLNYRWSFEEVSSAIKLVKPVMLVVDDSCSYWSLELLHKLPFLRFHVFLNGSSVIKSNGYGITSDSIKRPLKEFPTFDFLWAPECIALICFTSGTTGRPKGVAISHTSLIVQSLAKIAIVSYSENDVYLHNAPLCHIGGLSSGLAMLMGGGCHVFIPKFEAGLALQTIKQHSVTSFIVVPTMMADLISFSRKEKLKGRAESVKKILNGGGGLSRELIRGAFDIFPGAKLLSAYGMTETCSSLTFLTLHSPEADNFGKLQNDPGHLSDTTCRPSGICIGKPAPHVELHIASTEIQMGSFGVGRILTRGPHVMEKYWDQDSTMALNPNGNGWLDTGDIGWVDDSGDLWLLGRTKDQIKSGGENVYPEEVEAVLLQHPGVSGVVVVGIPDARLVEMVAACIRINSYWKWVDGYTHHRSPEKPEEQLSSNMLQNYCNQRNLSRFKIPRIFILWEKPFPITSTGKLRRDEVKREAMSQVQLLTSNL